jgi:hypothetical protein
MKKDTSKSKGKGKKETKEGFRLLYRNRFGGQEQRRLRFGSARRSG